MTYIPSYRPVISTHNSLSQILFTAQKLHSLLHDPIKRYVLSMLPVNSCECFSVKTHDTSLMVVPALTTVSPSFDQWRSSDSFGSIPSPLWERKVSQGRKCSDCDLLWLYTTLPTRNSPTFGTILPPVIFKAGQRDSRSLQMFVYVYQHKWRHIISKPKSVIPTSGNTNTTKSDTGEF